MRGICLGITGLALCALAAGGAEVCLKEGFEDAPLGKLPEGWSPFHQGSKPMGRVVAPGSEGSGKCLWMTGTTEQGFVALSKALSVAQDRIWLEFSFAFAAGAKRTFNLWSHEPGGKDASQINICIENGCLMQYDGRGKAWLPLPCKLEPTKDPAAPCWHRMRVVADRHRDGIDFFLSEPGQTKLPHKATATLPAYRTGLPLGSIDLVSGARLEEGSFYLIDNLVVKGGAELQGPHDLPPEHVPFALWDPERPAPTAEEAPLLGDVRFSVIKKREKEADGYNWLHGVAVVWHKGVLYSFYGHNKGGENTPTEESRGNHSFDDGRTWSPVWTIDTHTETEGRSHGVFLSHKGRLWAFVGRFGGKMAFTDLRMEAYVLTKEPASADDAGVTWESQGIAATGFWPCDEPKKMADGNWIMAGMDIPNGPGWAHPAVAISHGEDFTRWNTVLLPVPQAMRTIWGESTVIVEPDELVVIVRPGWQHDHALISTSKDLGRTWPGLRWTNLPMPSTKAYAGRLSTGQRYVVGTLVRNHTRRRHPLTIALSKPGEKKLSMMYRIRDDVFPEGPGESVKGAALSYPYAVEHEGFLYVVYSNDGARGKNLNSGEMAVIPVSSLVAPD